MSDRVSKEWSTSTFKGVWSRECFIEVYIDYRCKIIIKDIDETHLHKFVKILNDHISWQFEGLVDKSLAVFVQPGVDVIKLFTVVRYDFL